MVLETDKILFGGVFAILGLFVILSSASGAGFDNWNFIVGPFLVVIGVAVAVSETKDKNIACNFNEKTSSSKEKTVDGNQTTVEEEVVTRRITNENKATA